MNQLHFIVAGDINSPGNHYWQQHKKRNDVKRRPSCVSMAKFPIMITLLTLLILHTKIQNKVCIPSITTLLYMNIYYRFILHVSASFGHHHARAYPDTNITRKKDNCKHNCFMIETSLSF